MCLVISVLLVALGINFYLNGFYLQAFIMGIISIGLIFLMIRNVGCKEGFCGIKQDPDSTDT